ncbi:hypothetical protein M758_8G109200 [Ceratodon purpureus]|nr:hypothetical protein M758_8G109200 [Ceratodon purpureus]
MNVMFLHVVLLTADISLHHMCMYLNGHVILSISRSDSIHDSKYILSSCNSQHFLRERNVV